MLRESSTLNTDHNASRLSCFGRQRSSTWSLCFPHQNSGLSSIVRLYPTTDAVHAARLLDAWKRAKQQNGSFIYPKAVYSGVQSGAQLREQVARLTPILWSIERGRQHSTVDKRRAKHAYRRLSQEAQILRTCEEQVLLFHNSGQKPSVSPAWVASVVKLHLLQHPAVQAVLQLCRDVSDNTTTDEPEHDSAQFLDLQTPNLKRSQSDTPLRTRVHGGVGTSCNACCGKSLSFESASEIPSSSSAETLSACLDEQNHSNLLQCELPAANRNAIASFGHAIDVPPGMSCYEKNDRLLFSRETGVITESPTPKHLSSRRLSSKHFSPKRFSPSLLSLKRFSSRSFSPIRFSRKCFSPRRFSPRRSSKKQEGHGTSGSQENRVSLRLPLPLHCVNDAEIVWESRYVSSTPSSCSSSSPSVEPPSKLSCSTRSTAFDYDCQRPSEKKETSSQLISQDGKTLSFLPHALQHVSDVSSEDFASCNFSRTYGSHLVNRPDSCLGTSCEKSIAYTKNSHPPETGGIPLSSRVMKCSSKSTVSLPRNNMFPQQHFDSFFSSPLLQYSPGRCF